MAGVVLALLAFAATTTAYAAPTFSDPVDVAPGDTLASGVPSATYNGADILEIGWATLNVDEETLLSTARRPLGGPFAPGPPIGGLGDAQGPVLATAPGGQIFAAWVNDDSRIVASQLGDDGTPLGPVTISAAEEEASDPAIAVGADGRVAIAWTVLDELGENGVVYAVHGALGLPLVIHAVSTGEPNAITPDVAFDSAGVLQVAFTSASEDEAGRIKVAAETLLGPFAASRFVSPEGALASEPSIAPAPEGGLAIAWTEATATGLTVKVGVEPTPDAAFSTVDVPGGGAPTAPRLVVDPATGTVTVAWVRLSNADDAVGAALVATRAGGRCPSRRRRSYLAPMPCSNPTWPSRRPAMPWSPGGASSQVTRTPTFAPQCSMPPAGRRRHHRVRRRRRVRRHRRHPPCRR
ncbi:MAG: hypothetical protein M3401_03435 [Actinomycetota bacterium]|nr:hypothetical protein [Actinomycetota bacterium]